MRAAWDEAFERERRRFALRFGCDDCAHFDAPAERCGHGYPTEPHRVHVRLEVLIFCKEWELA